MGANTRDYEDETTRSAILSGNADLVQYLMSNGWIITVSMFEIIIDLNRSDILSNNIDKLSSDTLLGLLMYAINVNNLKMVNLYVRSGLHTGSRQTNDLDLCHQPTRKSYRISMAGIFKLLFSISHEVCLRFGCIFRRYIIENYAIDYTRLCAQTASQLINFALFRLQN